MQFYVPLPCPYFIPISNQHSSLIRKLKKYCIKTVSIKSYVHVILKFDFKAMGSANFFIEGRRCIDSFHFAECTIKTQSWLGTGVIENATKIIGEEVICDTQIFQSTRIMYLRGMGQYLLIDGCRGCLGSKFMIGSPPPLPPPLKIGLRLHF